MSNHDERDVYDRDGDSSPVEMDAPAGDFGSASKAMVDPKAIDDVIYSEIGINVLLSRLKQSIASARDFATFLKKRSTLEEEHAQGLKKLSRSTFDAARRHDARQGSYGLQFADMSRAHERMADHGIQFALSLHQMHEDLTELSNNIERGRKHWKQEGLNAEKKVKDAEALMEKAKSRYDSLAEDYDRARTGDKSGGRVFTVKGPKSAERHEEDLNRKLQGADADYASKVQGAQAARQENLTTSRPQAVRAIQELIKECDAGLTLQLQKFATFNEKLLVGNGMIVCPVKDGPGAGLPGAATSLRDMVREIDNERDLQQYITSHSRNIPQKPADIRYEKHPTLAPSQQTPFQPVMQNTQTARSEDKLNYGKPQSSTVRSQQGAAATPTTQSPRQLSSTAPVALPTSPVTPGSPLANQQGSQQGTPDRSYRGQQQDQFRSPQQSSQQYSQQYPTGPVPSQQLQTGGSLSQKPQPMLPVAQQYQTSPTAPSSSYQGNQQPQQQQYQSVGRQAQTDPSLQQQQYQATQAQAQRYPTQPQAYQSTQAQPANGPYSSPTQIQTANGPYQPLQQSQQQSAQRYQGVAGPTVGSNGNPTLLPVQPQAQPAQAQVQAQAQAPPKQIQALAKPVFGVSLDTLFRRDESPVPMVVHQCIQAIDLFGLDTEGIYRLSGNAAHITQLKSLFDSGDSARIDFRNPENFHHDVNSVAGLLKQFFKDLPDPLLTSEFYNDFIDAARIDDESMRRDQLHSVINGLPDPNYATLRALTLHLHRVQERSQTNRMNTSNLSICLGPTVMGPHRGPHMADAGLQARVLDTLVQNTYAIFDED